MKHIRTMSIRQNGPTSAQVVTGGDTEDPKISLLTGVYYLTLITSQMQGKHLSLLSKEENF